MTFRDDPTTRYSPDLEKRLHPLYRPFRRNVETVEGNLGVVGRIEASLVNEATVRRRFPEEPMLTRFCFRHRGRRESWKFLLLGQYCGERVSSLGETIEDSVETLEASASPVFSSAEVTKIQYLLEQLAFLEWLNRRDDDVVWFE